MIIILENIKGKYTPVLDFSQEPRGGVYPLKVFESAIVAEIYLRASNITSAKIINTLSIINYEI